MNKELMIKFKRYCDQEKIGTFATVNFYRDLSGLVENDGKILFAFGSLEELEKLLDERLESKSFIISFTKYEVRDVRNAVEEIYTGVPIWCRRHLDTIVKICKSKL